MANIQERRNKDGKLISYSVRVFRGRDAEGKQLKPWTATFEVQPTWTEKSARKKAEAFAATFERDCKLGLRSDDRQKFEAYCEYVIGLKEQRGVKHSTIVRYKELTQRIYPAIGHIKLTDLRVDHLNTLYSDLSKAGVRKGSTKAVSRIDLSEYIKKSNVSKTAIAKKANMAVSTIAGAINGDVVSTATAKAVAMALNLPFEKAFEPREDNRPLSAKTVIEHHRLISTALEQAVKEGIIPINIASRAALPKVEKKDVNYFQPEEIAVIRDALELELLKWKVFVHLLLITGARRGEILGLKWREVDFVLKRIRICNTVLYTADVGIYEDSPKNEGSKRTITLPDETIELLNEYKEWQRSEKNRLDGYYQDKDFVFAKDNGSPIHPDTVNDWLKKFSKRHGLPHINPHAFRHTMASMLYFNGVDSVSISKRLGHAQVSTTANIYAHVMEEADRRNADILSDIFLKNN